jgi:general stress protein YciG
MDPQRQRQIASLGGRAAHQQGTAHEFNSEEARAAGRKGGEVVSQNRAHMSEIGRKGGEASGGGRGSRRDRTPGRVEHASTPSPENMTQQQPELASAQEG